MTIADIVAEARLICDTDTTNYQAADMLRRVNAAYEEIVGKLIAVDKNWNFGDSNYSSLPTGTQNLVADQQDYTFDTTLLTLLRVEIKDANGIWQQLSPIDEFAITGAIPEYQKTSGLPLEYAKRENILRLFPAPASSKVTTTSGLKVYFQRTADVFTSGQVSTGTKTPGFASPYHVVLAYKAALPFCMSYKPDRVTGIMRKIAELEADMLRFYGSRDRDDGHKRLTMKGINYL